MGVDHHHHRYKIGCINCICRTSSSDSRSNPRNSKLEAKGKLWLSFISDRHQEKEGVNQLCRKIGGEHIIVDGKGKRERENKERERERREKSYGWWLSLTWIQSLRLINHLKSGFLTGTNFSRSDLSPSLPISLICISFPSWYFGCRTEGLHSYIRREGTKYSPRFFRCGKKSEKRFVGSGSNFPPSKLFSPLFLTLALSYSHFFSFSPSPFLLHFPSLIQSP